MFVNVAIDPMVLKTEAHHPDSHYRFLKWWLTDQRGVLVDLKDNERVSITSAAINDLKSGSVKEQWQNSYTRAQEEELMDPLWVKSEITPDVNISAPILKAISPYIDLLITTPDANDIYKDHIDVNEEGRQIIRFPKSELELETLDFFDLSVKVREYARLGELDRIDGDLPESELWDRYCKAYFEKSKNVHIVDRYALQNNRTGLGNFVRLASEGLAPSSKKSRELNIYVEPDGRTLPDSKLHAAIGKVRTILDNYSASPIPFSPINLYLLPPGKQQELYIDRFIRFGKFRVVGPGHGVALFENGYKPDTQIASVGIKVNIEHFIDKEIEFQQIAEKFTMSV